MALISVQVHSVLGFLVQFWNTQAQYVRFQTAHIEGGITDLNS